MNWQTNRISSTGLGNTAQIQFKVSNGPIGSKVSEITLYKMHQHTQHPQNHKQQNISSQLLPFSVVLPHQH